MEKKKKIAILGASYLQQPLVEKANFMNIETHCFAWDNENATCKNTSDFFYPISVLEKNLILEKCKEIKIDGITTIATDICIPTIAYVSENMELIGNSQESAIKSTNKGEMRKAFRSYGVPSPEYIMIEDENDIKNLSKFKYPLIVKPIDRSGSLGVQKVNNKTELLSAIENAKKISFQKKCVVEEFITGTEISVESISWKGKHIILAITDKITTGEPYFVELEHHQPSQLSDEVIDKAKAVTINVLDSLQIHNGAGHTEMKITNEGQIYVIECGARMGGDFIGSHLVPLSTGYDFIKAVIDISLDRFELPDSIKTKKYSGVYFLSKQTENLLPYFNQNNRFEIDKKINSNELIFSKNSNERSGYLIYQSDKKIILN